MSGERIPPFLEPQTDLAVRLTDVDLSDSPKPTVRKGGIGLAVAGLALLGFGFCAVGTANFIIDEYARNAMLGSIASLIAAIATILVLIGILRETRAVLALDQVDKLRADFCSTDPARRARAVAVYIKSLPEAAALRETLRGINDPDAMMALLRAGPQRDRLARADQLARKAALQAVAGIAAMPSPALAGCFIAWRGFRLLRDIATLYGLRPGLGASLSLVRHTAISAGGVAGAEIAANTAAHALLSSGLLQHLAGDAAGAGLAARRLLVLARACATACDPLPPA